LCQSFFFRENVAGRQPSPRLHGNSGLKAFGRVHKILPRGTPPELQKGMEGEVKEGKAKGGGARGGEAREGEGRQGEGK